MGPAEAREAALQLAPGCVRGQHLQPPHGPAGLLPVRPDADHRPPCRRHDRLCRATAPVGGRAVAGLARAVAAPIQGLRGATRGLRSHGHLGDDPPHAPSPRPPQPQAPACSVTSKTGFENDVLLHVLPTVHAHGLFIAINTILQAGASALFLAKFAVDAVIERLPLSTLFMGVPTLYTRLLSDPRFSVEICSGIRLFTSGSAPLS